MSNSAAGAADAGSLSSEESTVSVIIPTYNSLDLLKKCLDSVAAQTLEADRIECLVVDDGSTDGTWDYLTARASQWPGLRIFHQPNAGRPSVGRNRCIAIAQSTYLYFLDSDDWLGTDALRRMLKAADHHGSDVVLGRGKGVGTKGVNKQTFARTVYDADLIDDHAWRILAPWKLFRTSLIERLHLRFPEDQVQGEDQVFVATCYFNASKITILGDYDYHYVHGRSSMENLSRQGQSLDNKRLTTTRMTALIIQHTSPGARRDALLKRILLRTLVAAFGPTYLGVSAAEQGSFLATIKEEVLTYLSEALLSEATDSVRLRLAAATWGSTSDVAEVIRAIRGGLAVTVVDDHLLADFSPALNELLGDHRRLSEPVVLRHRIVDVERVDRRPIVTVQITLPLVTPPVSRVQLVGTSRQHEDVETVTGTVDDRGRYVFDLGPHDDGSWNRWSRGPKATIWTFRLEVYSAQTLVGAHDFSWQAARQTPLGRQHFDWVELIAGKPKHVTLYRRRNGQVGLRVGRAAARESAVIMTSEWPEMSITFPADTPVQDMATRALDLDGQMLWEAPPTTTGVDEQPVLINTADLPRRLINEPMIIEVTTDRMLCQTLVNESSEGARISRRSPAAESRARPRARLRHLVFRLRQATSRLRR